MKDVYFDTVDTEKMMVDYFPGRLASENVLNNYPSMGRPLRGQNVLVVNEIHMKRGGKNLLEKAAVALLSDPTMELDIVVIDSILDERWYERLLEGKYGRRRWLPSPMGRDQQNVYLTREQVVADFFGGTRHETLKNKKKDDRKNKTIRSK